MNNSSLQLVPVKQPVFQARLGQYFGRNLLFSQFTSHQLLRLLPTNQWIRPLLRQLPPTPHLEQQLAATYGTDFVRIYVEAIRQQAQLQAIWNSKGTRKLLFRVPFFVKICIVALIGLDNSCRFRFLLITCGQGTGPSQKRLGPRPEPLQKSQLSRTVRGVTLAKFMPAQRHHHVRCYQ